MAINLREPSEFGGDPGRIQDGREQGFEHLLTGAERARLERETETTDPGDSPELALIREWEREGRA